MTKIAILSIALLLVNSSAAADASLGSCDEVTDRSSAFIYAKIEGYSENDDTIEFFEACTNEPRKLRRCAIQKSEKRKLQRACSPTDGSPEYFEPSYRIDYFAPAGGSSPK